eukprot:6428027-Amphidinium_carterae.2
MIKHLAQHATSEILRQLNARAQAHYMQEHDKNTEHCMKASSMLADPIRHTYCPVALTTMCKCKHGCLPGQHNVVEERLSQREGCMHRATLHADCSLVGTCCT